jgi:ADP-ribose pyrophosphatase YjhB (NUDIX family)
VAGVLALGGIAAGLLRARMGGAPTSGTMTLVLDPQQRVLLVRASYRRHWALPGGFLDPGEDPVAGASREVLEETGYRLACAPRLVARRSRRNHVDHLLTGRVEPAKPVALSTAWEIGAVAWLPYDRLPVLHPICETIIERCGGLAALIDVT